MVVHGQVIPQEYQRRKVKRAAFEQLEHEWEASRKTGCGEAPKGWR